MKTREIVLPGDLIEERKGRKLGSGVYLEGEKIFSKVLGISRIDENEISVIALSGAYIPKVGDRVIGIIREVEISGWSVDINSPYTPFLPFSEAVEEFVEMSRTDLSRYFDIGDIIYCRVSKVTKNKVVQISMADMSAKKLYGGIILKITPTKIPRLIGRGGSMIGMIEERTKCNIIPGQNGMVWIRGDDKAKAIEAILTVEKESHTSGLTEKIEAMLA